VAFAAWGVPLRNGLPAIALLNLAMATDAEDRQEHRRLQKEYGSFYRAVSDILFQHNPIELENKRNTGEYNAEVDSLLLRIGEAENPGALQELLFEIFRSDFGEDSCGSKERYHVVASDIWKAYERHRAKQPAG
jgi:hypothetical protein